MTNNTIPIFAQVSNRVFFRRDSNRKKNENETHVLPKANLSTKVSVCRNSTKNRDSENI